MTPTSRLIPVLGLACAGFFAALPALAAPPAEGENLAEKQALVVAIPDTLKVLDPGRNIDRAGDDALRQLFEGLMNEGPDGRMQPGVAASHEISEDRKTYIFHLREAKWSNGDPVTAGDFVYAWRRAVDPATAGGRSWYFQLMGVQNAGDILRGQKKPDELGVRAIDDRTLSVSLAAPAPYFLQTLAQPITFPLPRSLIEAEGEGWTRAGKLVGNGAFQLESHDPGSEAVLRPNPHYWNAGETLLTELRLVTETDPEVALSRYLAGGIDLVTRPPAGKFAQLRQDYPDQALAQPLACSYAYVFNLSEKGPAVLRDPRVRQALSYAVDRADITAQVLGGGQRPAFGWTHWATAGFTPPDFPLAGLSPDARLEQAQTLLAEAGYGTEKPLKLTIAQNISEGDDRLSQALRQGWEQIGIQAEPVAEDWKTHSARLRRQDFEIARYAWCADYNEASSFLNVFRSDGVNPGRWANADYDALLAQAATATDPAPIYRQAEELLMARQPLIPVYHYARPMLIQPDLRGWPKGNAMGSWYARDLYRVAD